MRKNRLFVLLLIFSASVYAEPQLYMSVNNYLDSNGKVTDAIVTSGLDNFPQIIWKKSLERGPVVERPGNFLTDGTRVFFNTYEYLNTSYNFFYYINLPAKQLTRLTLEHLAFVYGLTLRDNQLIGSSELSATSDNSKGTLQVYNLPDVIEPKDGSRIEIAKYLFPDKPETCRDYCKAVASAYDHENNLWVLWGDHNKFNYLAKYNDNKLIFAVDLRNKVSQQFYRIIIAPNNNIYLLQNFYADSKARSFPAAMAQFDPSNTTKPLKTLIIWNTDKIAIPQILGVAFYKNKTFISAGNATNPNGTFVYRYEGTLPERTLPDATLVLPGITDITTAEV